MKQAYWTGNWGTETVLEGWGGLTFNPGTGGGGGGIGVDRVGIITGGEYE